MTIIERLFYENSTPSGNASPALRDVIVGVREESFTPTHAELADMVIGLR